MFAINKVGDGYMMSLILSSSEDNTSMLDTGLYSFKNRECSASAPGGSAILLELAGWTRND